MLKIDRVKVRRLPTDQPLYGTADSRNVKICGQSGTIYVSRTDYNQLSDGMRLFFARYLMQHRSLAYVPCVMGCCQYQHITYLQASFQALRSMTTSINSVSEPVRNGESGQTSDFEDRWSGQRVLGRSRCYTTGEIRRNFG